eukprot:374001-Rhodomonas_salina.2
MVLHVAQRKRFSYSCPDSTARSVSTTRCTAHFALLTRQAPLCECRREGARREGGREGGGRAHTGEEG